MNKLIEGIIISPWANKNYYYEIEKFLKQNYIECFLQNSHFKGICNVDGKEIKL